MPENVSLLTHLMRGSPDEFWSALREVLARRNVDAGQSVLAVSVQQGDDSEFAVLLTDGDEIVTLSWRPSTASVIEWTPITTWWSDSPYRSDIEAALQLRPNA